MEFIWVYRCHHNGPFTLDIDEIDEGDWCSTVDISTRVDNNDTTLTETFKVIWRRYSKSKKVVISYEN